MNLDLSLPGAMRVIVLGQQVQVQVGRKQIMTFRGNFCTKSHLTVYPYNREIWRLFLVLASCSSVRQVSHVRENAKLSHFSRLISRVYVSRLSGMSLFELSIRPVFPLR